MKVQTTTEHFSNLFPCKVGYEYAFDAREHLTLIVSNPLKPPPLTGREDQIRFLTQRLDAARAGKGCLVLVSGEAGIGKSRLLEEVSEQARAIGFRVLTGSCLPGVGAAYLPFQEIVDGYFGLTREGKTSWSKRLIHSVKRSGPEIAGAVPMVGGVLKLTATMYAEYHASKSDKSSPEFGRTFSAMLDFLREASSHQPLLILLDDLQWADSASIQMLHFLARNSLALRVVLVGTYRPEELHRETEGKQNPLLDSLRIVRREGICEELSLDRLSADQTKLVIQGMLGSTISDELSERIVKESGGNPLFTIETIRLLVDTRAITLQNGKWEEKQRGETISIPSTVLEVIRRRLDEVPEMTRRELSYASVLGEVFEPSTLAEILGIERVQMLEDLDGIERRFQLVRPFEGAYRFSNEKVRRVLYDGIPTELRKELHGKVGMIAEKRSRQPGLDMPRVAVLPFANISPDPNDEYFADGMTDEIISVLSKIEQAEIISRTSVMQYKKAAKSIKEVSKELNVGTVIEGSVRKSGNRLRVTVQMIDAVKDRHLWAESYDGELQDVFTIQNEIALRVADALQAKMPQSGPSMIEHTRSVEAYTLYLRAMQLYHENTESSLREAVVLFEKAISKDPAFVRAYAGLAHALCGLAVGYEDFTASIGKAEAVARKAQELGPYSAEANLAMAYVHTFMDKFDEVISEAEKAIGINPNLSEAYRSLGWINSSMGKLEAGVRDLQRAYELDPLSFRPGSEVSLVFQLAGREREALELLERLRDLYPRNHRVYARWAEFYMLKRDFVNAQEMVSTGLRISPTDIDLLTDQGLLYAFTDRRSEAVQVLRDIETNMTEASRLQGQGFIHAALGNLDEAFKALLRMAEIHSWPPLIKSLPVFDDLRKDHRFAGFCLKVGLPP